MRRVVSVWLPTWPTDRLKKARRAPPKDRPFATAHHDGRRRIIAAVDLAARAEGLSPGMTLSHAKMLVPDLAVEDADPAADLEGLHRLATWCQRDYTPLTAPDPPAGLWLDVTGCSHLWGSEEALLADLQRRLGRASILARAALADTPGAAHAMARFGRQPLSVVTPAGHVGVTCGLPIMALRLPTDIVTGLRRLGFETIDHLMATPRPQLALRFGSEPGRRLDQLAGSAFEPIDPILAPETVRRRVSFAEPISTAPAIEIGMKHVTALVCSDLDNHGLGARRLDLVCERVDGSRQVVRVGLAQPTRAVQHLVRLLGQQIEGINPGFGIEAMVLSVPLAEPLRPEIVGNLVHREPDVRDLAALVDSLSNRFGSERLYRAEPVESDVPERSVRFVPPLTPLAGISWPLAFPRPARLLSRPEPVETTALLPDHPPALFIWRQVRHRVRRVDGPERIHGEWWRSEREVEAVRDYFRIEDEAGARFWLFRTDVSNEARWFMHGLFGS